MLIVGVTLLLMVALTLFIAHSRMGRACRACAEDMGMANLLGIDTNRVISFTFVLGAMLAAVGGVLIALTIGKLNPYIGFIAGIKAFTAAVLGGIGSIPGAMLGGVLLGLAETFAAGYMPSGIQGRVLRPAGADPAVPPDRPAGQAGRREGLSAQRLTANEYSRRRMPETCKNAWPAAALVTAILTIPLQGLQLQLDGYRVVLNTHWRRSGAVRPCSCSSWPSLRLAQRGHQAAGVAAPAAVSSA
jgi:hypothetical protein